MNLPNMLLYLQSIYNFYVLLGAEMVLQHITHLSSKIVLWEMLQLWGKN